MTSTAVLLFVVAIFIMVNANNIIDLYDGKIKFNQTLNDKTVRGSVATAFRPSSLPVKH